MFIVWKQNAGLTNCALNFFDNIYQIGPNERIMLHIFEITLLVFVKNQEMYVVNCAAATWLKYC